MILDCLNCFGQVQIILLESKSFWSGSNQTLLDYFSLFGPVQNDLDPTKTNQICPKCLVLDQNYLDYMDLQKDKAYAFKNQLQSSGSMPHLPVSVKPPRIGANGKKVEWVASGLDSDTSPTIRNWNWKIGNPAMVSDFSKFFIMSTEFDKNISD